jgi:glycosyltransferase involved in cell wall biosynthesis
MKLLYLITRAESGGAQVHVRDLIAGLRDTAEIVLATGEEGFLTEAARDLGVRVHILQNLVQPTTPRTDLRCVAELVSLLKAEKPDLLHAHTSKAGAVGRIAAAIAGVPAVFTAHSWAFSQGTSWKWKAVGVPMEFAAARLGRRIINVSEANFRLARRWRIAPPAGMVTIPNGIPDSPRRARPGAQGMCRITMVARFAPQKDHRTALEAFALAAAPECRLQFLGLSGRVAFLGDRRDVDQILAASHAFLLASHYEGLPLTILEAMRAGLPVLASDVGGNREAVRHGVNGYLSPRADAAGLAAHIRRLAAEPALRASLGLASRRLYEQSFQLPIMVAKTAVVYRDVLAAAGRRFPALPAASVQPERTPAL